MKLLPGLPPPWMDLSHRDSWPEGFGVLIVILFVVFSIFILFTGLFCYFKYVQNPAKRKRNEEMKIREQIAEMIGPEAYWASPEKMLQLIPVEKHHLWQKEIQQLSVLVKDRFQR